MSLCYEKVSSNFVGNEVNFDRWSRSVRPSVEQAMAPRPVLSGVRPTPPTPSATKRARHPPLDQASAPRTCPPRSFGTSTTSDAARAHSTRSRSRCPSGGGSCSACASTRRPRSKRTCAPPGCTRGQSAYRAAGPSPLNGVVRCGRAGAGPLHASSAACHGQHSSRLDHSVKIGSQSAGNAVASASALRQCRRVKW